MTYYDDDYPRRRSRLGAAIRGFFDPDESYRSEQRAFSAERDARYASRSARNSEERAMSAERELNWAERDLGRAETAAEYNARLYEEERYRRQRAQRRSAGYAREGLRRGYGYGYEDGRADMYGAAQRQGRVGYRRGVRDGYEHRVGEEQAAFGYGTFHTAPSEVADDSLVWCQDIIIPITTATTTPTIVLPVLVPAAVLEVLHPLRTLVNGAPMLNMAINVRNSPGEALSVVRSPMIRTAINNYRLECTTRNGMGELRLWRVVTRVEGLGMAVIDPVADEGVARVDS
ncbi:MAG: hypothetical protein Q9166_001954 [cf. Caloplaca sp. 2 TL-2023]